MSCNPCHFPPVVRPGRDNGAPRQGRSHLLNSWRSRNLTTGPLVVRTELSQSNDTLRVTVANETVPHNIPTDSRNRALDLVVTFYGKGGLPVPPSDRTTLEYGQEDGTYRLRFRNPYRTEYGKKNSQIPSGSQALLEAAVPLDAGDDVRIQLLYKLTPFTTDEEAIKILDWKTKWSVSGEINLPPQAEGSP